LAARRRFAFLRYIDEAALDGFFDCYTREAVGNAVLLEVDVCANEVSVFGTRVSHVLQHEAVDDAAGVDGSAAPCITLKKRAWQRDKGRL
jgi:hypothetical protein